LARVRRWRKKLLDSGVSEVTAAKAYRLLRAVFNTALDDGLIRRNPCRIKGADRENSPERPVLTVTQVYALADAVGLRYRALILLAAFTSLRWAELAALTPADIDLDARIVRVTRQLYYSCFPVRQPGSRWSACCRWFSRSRRHLGRWRLFGLR
jgi:integrase